MRKSVALAVAPFALVFPALAQEMPDGALSPNQIVNAAEPEEWVLIPREDLLVMTLAPDAQGNPREVIVQLMPPPISGGWVYNIRLLARSGWYDGTSVNRVQDNYVVQWGDPNYDNPEATGEAKRLPEGLKVMDEDEYTIAHSKLTSEWKHFETGPHGQAGQLPLSYSRDAYATATEFRNGWPMARYSDARNSPVHCYGMVGVGRGYSPDTGSGAELYTVIGHAPRHLDRNIALVGRIIEGMEHLSSLPRGSGTLGFYADDEFDKRTPIVSIRIANDLLPSSGEAAGRRYSFEYLSSASTTFARYARARANRRDPFFIVAAGGADICNIPVPVRRVATDD